MLNRLISYSGNSLLRTMYFFKYKILFITLIISNFSIAQTIRDSSLTSPIYKRVAIPKPNAEQLTILNDVGVDLTCGVVQRNDSLLIELSDYTLNKLELEGIAYKVLIEDMSEHYANRSKELPKARKELKEMKTIARKKRKERVKERRAARKMRRNRLDGSQ